mmetsp:Transcript_42085/g.95091  ORF Transcript_42085/g.95091 Transcript_42085/m.95091 type:complete len:231 (-) Transcript_42085:713-1405(-)
MRRPRGGPRPRISSRALGSTQGARAAASSQGTHGRQRPLRFGGTGWRRQGSALWRRRPAAKKSTVPQPRRCSETRPAWRPRRGESSRPSKCPRPRSGRTRGSRQSVWRWLRRAFRGKRGCWLPQCPPPPWRGGRSALRPPRLRAPSRWGRPWRRLARGPPTPPPGPGGKRPHSGARPGPSRARPARHATQPTGRDPHTLRRPRPRQRPRVGRTRALSWRRRSAGLWEGAL